MDVSCLQWTSHAAMITFRLHYVDSKERVARTVAVWLRNHGLSLLCHLPQTAAQLCCLRKCNHLVHNTQSRVVDRPRSQFCSWLCNCPLVVRSSDSMGRSARDRVGPGRISRIVHNVGSKIKTRQSKSLINWRLGRGQRAPNCASWHRYPSYRLGTTYQALELFLDLYLICQVVCG